MDLPRRCELPFFAYGLFRPGQLGFLRLRDFILSSEPNCTLPGTLLQRDGLPIIDETGHGEVKGVLLFFKSGAERKAYQAIVEMEPDEHYRWGSGSVVAGGMEQRANVLFGKSPRKGSWQVEDGGWDGRDDPLFTSALGVVEETLRENGDFDQELRSFFKLQMAYLLLWSSIERYVSLRYHLGDKVMDKVNCLAEEPAFVDGLARVVAVPREVYRSDRPTERVRLDRSDPKKSLLYYYQVRSNITHRGKMVHDSLAELLEIFQIVLRSAFEAADES